LLRAHRAGEDARVRRHDDAAAAAIGIAQEFFGRRPGRKLFDHRLVDTTNALLICANACESTATRLRIGSPLVGKWFGQLMTWMRVPSAISANTASGLEFSPQISP